MGKISNHVTLGNSFLEAFLRDVVTDLTNLRARMATNLYGSATYDPPSLTTGSGATTTVTVTGAVVGDVAEAGFSNDLQGIVVTAYISAADTASVRFQNNTGGTLDLASGTLKVRVTPATALVAPTAQLSS